MKKISDFYYDMFFKMIDSNPTKSFSILSNLLELEFDNPQYICLMIFVLELYNKEETKEDWIISLYRQLVKIRAEEPHSHLNLAQALLRKANKNLKVGKEHEVYDLYTEASILLQKVILGSWDPVFTQIELTAIMELNRLMNFVSTNIKVLQKVTPNIENRLLSKMTLDLRVYVQWDTQMSNVELHVVEPTGEKCYSFNNQTKIGGMMSRDFTNGYGPVEYLLKNAVKGKYEIFLKYYGGIERITGTTAVTKIYTHFGRPGKEQEHITVAKLDEKKQTIHIATVEF